MNLDLIINSLLRKRSEMPGERAVLAGISGIDASGKGFIANKLRWDLERQLLRVALVNADGWLNLPKKRFDQNDLPGGFYRNALRLDEMFENLILPLKENRRVSVTADRAEETASEYRQHTYTCENIDIILLEGIFLFKKEYVTHFDIELWIDCSFETALKRAIKRSQEGLSSEATKEAYENIYFPAQRIHFELDDPMTSVDIVIRNDQSGTSVPLNVSNSFSNR